MAQSRPAFLPHSSTNPGHLASDEGPEYIDNSRFKPLYKAICKDDWSSITDILQRKKEAINAKISLFGRIPLHVAIIFGHLNIVENLVKRMSVSDLTIQDSDGNTALSHAALYGNIKIADLLIEKSIDLATIENREGYIPLVMACLAGREDMSRYLYSVTPLKFRDEKHGGQIRSLVLACFIDAKMFDVALDMAWRYPYLSMVEHREQSTPMISLACNPTAFPSGYRPVFWKRWIYDCIHIQPPTVSSDFCVNISQKTQIKLENNKGKELCQFRTMVLKLLELFGIRKIYNMKLMHTRAYEVLRFMIGELSHLNTIDVIGVGVLSALFQAAEQGIVEFVEEVIKADFELIYYRDTDKRRVFHYAIKNRQEKVFNLLYGLGSRKLRVLSGQDSCGNNTMHLVALLPLSSRLNHISGAALQMQRELQWFKEVESLANPLNKERINNDGETPRQVFSREHKDLVKRGEKWMKGTATSCTVVGALIITIMFAAAFTVPGGNNQDADFPIFLHKKPYKVFIIFDSISLFSSSTSVLMFLGILTSRYAEDDFLVFLPTKLIIGLSTLFFSIAAMMLAFSAALLIMLEGQMCIIIPIILFASLPVTLFVWLQFPLLVEIFMSTYGPSIFDRKMKPWL